MNLFYRNQQQVILALLIFFSLAGGCNDLKNNAIEEADMHEKQASAFAAIRSWGGDVRCHNLRFGWPPKGPSFWQQSPEIDDVVIAIYNSPKSNQQPALEMTDDRLGIVADLSELRFLQLGNTNITDAGLKNLRGLSLLEGLDLSNTRITDKGLANLHGLYQLESLQLQHTAVSDEGLNHLRGLKRLEELFLQDTKVTTAGIHKLKKALPKLRVVSSLNTNPGVDLAVQSTAFDSEVAQYILVDQEPFGRKSHLLAIDTAPARDMVARWIIQNCDALEIVSFSSRSITMPHAETLIVFKKDGDQIRYTIRENMSIPYPRGDIDIIDDVLSYSEINAIVEIFRKYGKLLDNFPETNK